MELEVHPVQVSILQVLLFNPEARFAELNVQDLTTDHFSFHIKRLVEVGLVQKNSRGKYTLTARGKEFANRFDTEESLLERQAKIAVLVCPVRNTGNAKEYLIQRRLKQPYYGYHGFITGKIRWGESPPAAARRELKEETGLGGTVKLVGIKHKVDYSQNGKLLEDKYFFVYRATDLAGRLKIKFEGGRNDWLSKKEVLSIDKLFDGVDESLEMISQDDLVYSESRYEVSGY